MRKKLAILIVALVLLAGAQMALLGSAPAPASSGTTCETFCSEDLEGCICCSRCCRSESGQVICTPGACICP